MLNSLSGIKKQNLVSSIMLVSSDEFALSQASIYIAKLLLCGEDQPCNACTICKKIEHNNHADVMIFPQEKNAITVEEMLKIVDSVLLSPYEADKKIYILNNFSQTNALAQNKLLKTLEEPPKNVYFVLNVKSEAKVLPTIKSRCRKIYLSKFSDDDIKQKLLPYNLSESEKNEIVSYCCGYIYSAINFATKDNFFEILNLVYDMWENMKSSGNALFYANKLYGLKSDFSLFLLLYESVLQDLIYVKLNKPELVKNTQKIEWYKNVANCFLSDALSNIDRYIVNINQRLERNCNQAIIIDNMLMKILEERARC